MGMVGHGRTPAVEHGGDADARAEVFRVGGNRQQCLGRCLEQKVVDHRLVLIGDVGDWAWECEDEVEVADWQELGLARGEPVPRRGTLALGAVPVAAGVVGDRRVLAVLAACDVAAERHRSAALDRAHHLELAEADVTGVGGTPCGPVVAEDVRDIQGGTGRGRDGGYVAGSAFLPLLAPLGGWDRRSSGLSMLAIMPVATRV
jgi:hypothetical protein